MALPKTFKNLKVVSGAGRGKELGVPTINLDPSKVLDLKEGIYVAKAILSDKSYWGLLHFGPRPTFAEKAKTLEIYLLDFDPLEKIPKKIDLEAHSLIRNVLKFKTSDAMMLEIEKDIKKGRALIKKLSL